MKQYEYTCKLEVSERYTFKKQSQFTACGNQKHEKSDFEMWKFVNRSDLKTSISQKKTLFGTLHGLC